MKNPTLSERMRGNTNACKGFPTKPNRKRYPLTDGFPLMCEGCHVGPRCPKYEAGAVCAFRKEFEGLESRAVAAVQAEVHDLARAQRSRVMRGLMFESLMLGGVPDPDVGAEIDRMANLLTLLAKLQGTMGQIGSASSEGRVLMTLFPELHQ